MGLRPKLDALLNFFRSGSRRNFVIAIAVGLAVLGASLEYYRRRPKRRQKTALANASKDVCSACSGRDSSGLQGSSAQCRISTSDNSPTRNSLIYMGSDSLSEFVRLCEKALVFTQAKGSPDGDEVITSLNKILERAHDLQDEMNGLLSSFGQIQDATEFASAVGVSDELQTYASALGSKRTMSILSDDSFASAFEDFVPAFGKLDIALREPLDLDPSEMALFHDAIRSVRKGQVTARLMRTEFLRCGSDEEFLAKLHCVRTAFERVFSEGSTREWLVDQGRAIILGILKRAHKDSSAFAAAFGRLLDYVQSDEAKSEIEAELRDRKVPVFSFYDVVLDFILMDAFDDLARPPSSVLAVAQNRFLSASFKESTLATVVWSVLKAKRSRLKKANGFISHFYDVSEQVSPTFAWGFLGTDAELRDLCYYFKDQICTFLIDIFSFSRVHYTTVPELACDIEEIIRYRLEMTRNRITSEVLEE